jgi:CSLREA domain-containing protein
LQEWLVRVLPKSAFLAGLAALGLAFSLPDSAAVVLHDQYNNDAGADVPSNDISDDPAVSSEVADDFVVPAGQRWRINEVNVRRGAQSGVASSYTITFYENTSGLPGAVRCSYVNIPSLGNTDLVFGLSPECVLEAGTYWLSVRGEGTRNSAFFWEMRTVESNAGAVWREAGGFHTGCLDWANRNTCLGINFGDQMFRLAGAITNLVPFVVTNLTDHNDGACNADCTLREASNAANARVGEDRIQFAAGLAGVIQLSSALPTLSSDVIVDGPGANIVTVRRNFGGNYRIFTVSNSTESGPTVEIRGLSLVNGMVSGSTFPDNSGGALFCDRSRVTLTDCALTGNSAIGGGALLSLGPADVTLRRCTISGNTASINGGGVYNASNSASTLATMTLENCTISANGANGGIGGNGGGISNFCSANNGTSVVKLRNCTVSDNSANSGGGVHNNRSSGIAQVQARSTIFKTGTSGSNIVNTGGATLISLGYNLSDDNGGGSLTATGDQVNTNAMLGPLQNNGGATFTHALLAGSPAIDKGESFGLSTDQRGVGYLRIIDDPAIAPASGGDNADIGAFEFGASFTAVSRKIHGAIARDINLPLTGVPFGIECRRDTGTDVSGPNAGRDHQLVVTFPSPVTVSAVTIGTGIFNELATATFGVMSNVVTVDLHNIPDAPRRLTIGLLDVSDGTSSSNVSIPMGVLAADTSGNGSVNATDVGQTKSKSGQAVDAINFRSDVNINGAINSSDVSTVKLKSGTALP